jgi:UDP-glucose 4-epimerase
MSRWFIAGGAGFIGSHFTDRLLSDPSTSCVTLYDNFSTGREWHYAHHSSDPRLTVIHADIQDTETLRSSLAGHDVMIHLASNADIALAISDPDIDFREGTLLTRQVLEAARVTGVRKVLYASGSGVYGDLNELEADEDYGPMLPISTYAASKLAGEALLASYCYLFGFRACAFRFGNVVGSRQTHGVGFDFLRQLLANPHELRILGDGSQSKSYIHVEDVINAVLCAYQKTDKAYEVYNVATGDYTTVTQIAQLAVSTLGLDPGAVRLLYSGGDRGWKGDVPVVRLNTDRIRSLGWTCSRSSLEALRDSLRAMLSERKTI